MTAPPDPPAQGPTDRLLAAVRSEVGRHSAALDRSMQQTGTALALARIDPARRPAVMADLELVDQLQERLAEMTFPHPHGGEPMTAALPLEQLLRAARHTILHWHETDQRTGAGS